jgi:HEAT repeat protein
VPALTHAQLRDPDPAVRVESALALWKIDRKGAPVVAVLVQALADPNELICWMAADGLGQMGPEAQEAAPALRQALRRDFKIALIRTGITLALERIESQASAAAGPG